MRIAGETVGARGVTLLATSAIVGVMLGVHGWSGRHNGLPAALAGLHASPTAKAKPAPSASAPSAGPTQGPVASSPAATPAPTPGPKLSSQSYASYAFQVWPGPLSQAARAAQTGLVIKVQRHGAGIMVTAGVAGQTASAPKFYPAGAKVYVIEAAMGDDSGNSDYNLGDDGLVVTDSLGRIVQ
ncbi:MAG TPA: hypothetical protein VEM58_07875 [Streptosporangiaceae bacterium]|nr:hypothetical protein [Streptosporangiaceae bacterium]